MSDGDSELEIIEQIYATAMEPERFDELVDIWHDKLKTTGENGFKYYPGESARLKAHMQRADTILALVDENQSALPTPLFQKINGEPRPTLVIDAAGKILAVNEAAQHHFELENKQDISEWISDPDDRNKILEAVRSGLSQNSPVEKFSPELFRVWTDNFATQMLLSVDVWTTTSGRQLALLQSSNFIWPSSLSSTMAKAFELTGAEIDVIKLIVEGASLQDVAERRGSKILTVRSQMKSIYAKTDTNNQSEFLRMTLGLVTLKLRDEFSVVGAFKHSQLPLNNAWPLPEHLNLMSLPDGRVLEYADCGPSDGIPCLYFHNEFLGNIWPQSIAKETISRGFRVIIPSRAYYGQTSPYSDGALNYDQTADDVAALLDHLSIEQALLVSISTGGMFSVAFADKFPDRCAGQVALAPAFAVTSAEEERQMPKFYRFMNSIVTRHPRLLESILKLGMAYHNRVGSVRYLHRILGDVPSDVAVINDVENLDAIIRALEFSGQHGHLAVFNDYKTLFPNSNEALKNLPIPLFAIIGSEDRNSRLMRAERLIQSGINIRTVIAEGGGTMLLFTHAKLVAETIEKAWALRTEKDS